jgi:hypothetical protein
MNSEKNNSISSVILSWLRDILPSVTAAGSILYHWLLRKINRLEKQNEALRLELKNAKDDAEIERQTDGMSDTDVIRAAIDGRLGNKPDGKG